MRLVHRLRNWRNPHNQTALHLAPLARRYGFKVGEHSYGRPKVRFPESGRMLTIGRYCSIADRVEILLGGNHRTDWGATFPFAAFAERWPGAEAIGTGYNASRGDVVIGSDVWLGSGSMILSGVTIGHGAVVGARAVVTRDVPAYGVVGGSPGKLLKYRFDERTIAAMLEGAWWDLPDAEVARLVLLLQSPRVDELIRAVAAVRARSGAARASAPSA